LRITSRLMRWKAPWLLKSSENHCLLLFTAKSLSFSDLALSNTIIKKARMNIQARLKSNILWKTCIETSMALVNRRLLSKWIEEKRTSIVVKEKWMGAGPAIIKKGLGINPGPFLIRTLWKLVWRYIQYDCYKKFFMEISPSGSLKGEKSKKWIHIFLEIMSLIIAFRKK
jgi:hypothetical protein